MKTVPLSEARNYCTPDQGASSSEAQIYGEIAERILELVSTTSISRVGQWIAAADRLRQRDPEALVWFMRFQTGNLEWLTRSYTEIGRDGQRTKQAVEQSFDRAMQQVREANPRLYDAIVQLRQLKRREDEEDAGTTG